MKVYIVTDMEAGWDCVIGVYYTKESAEERAKQYCAHDNYEDYLLHIFEEEVK